MAGESIIANVTSTANVTFNTKKHMGNITVHPKGNIIFRNPIEVHGDLKYGCIVKGADHITLHGQHEFIGPKALSDKDFKKVVK